jgi:hypothetical protein
MRPFRSREPSAAAFARSAEQQFNELARALQSARADMAQIRRVIKVPVPKGSSRYVRGSRTGAPFVLTAFENAFGRLAGDAFLDAIGLAGKGNYYVSAAQTASSWADSMQQGMRIQ